MNFHFYSINKNKYRIDSYKKKQIMHHNDIIISSMCMLIKRQGLGIYMKNVKQLNVCVNLVGGFLVYFCQIVMECINTIAE